MSTATLKKIQDYRVVQHGVCDCQFFQGHGISCTSWADCATGCGYTEQEALEDALESLAQNGWDTGAIGDKLDDKQNVSDVLDIDDYEDCDSYFYVSVDVK